MYLPTSDGYPHFPLLSTFSGLIQVIPLYLYGHWAESLYKISCLYFHSEQKANSVQLL